MICLGSGITTWVVKRQSYFITIIVLINFIFSLETCRQKGKLNSFKYKISQETHILTHYWIYPKKSFNSFMPKMLLVPWKPIYNSAYGLNTRWILTSVEKKSQKEKEKKIKRLIIFKWFKGYCTCQVFSLVEPLEFLMM